MPIYEFECNKCGQRLEVQMSLADEPPKTCPRKGCRGKLHKVFSPPVIIFKGSGFHVNDYSSTGPKSAAAAKDRPAPSSDPKPSTGTDS